MFREAIDRALDKAKDLVDTVTKKTETEKKLDEALSKKNWGASSSLLNELARLTQDPSEYPVIMREVWASLNQDGKNWRVIFKGLTLLEVLIKSGSERVVDDARDHLFRIRTLTDFTHHDETSDKGHGVREKSKQLVELLNDTARIREERAKTRELKSKYVGIGTEGGSGTVSGRYDDVSRDSSRYSGSGGGGRYDDPRSGSTGRYDDNGSSKPQKSFSDQASPTRTSGGTVPGLPAASERGDTVSEADDIGGGIDFDAAYRAPPPNNNNRGKAGGGKIQIKMSGASDVAPAVAAKPPAPAPAPVPAPMDDFDPFAAPAPAPAPRAAPAPAPVPAPAPAYRAPPAPVDDFDPFAAPAPAPPTRAVPAPAPASSFDPFSTGPSNLGSLGGLASLDFSAPPRAPAAAYPVAPVGKPVTVSAPVDDFGDFQAAGPKDQDLNRLVSLDGLSLVGRGEAPAPKAGQTASGAKGPTLSAMKPMGGGAPAPAPRPVMAQGPPAAYPGYPGGGFPSTGGGFPSTGGGFPSAGGGFPSAGGGFPSTGGGFPGGGFPSAGGGYPGAGGGYPGGPGGYPGGFPSTGGGGYPGGAFPSAGGGFPGAYGPGPGAYPGGAPFGGPAPGYGAPYGGPRPAPGGPNLMSFPSPHPTARMSPITARIPSFGGIPTTPVIDRTPQEVQTDRGPRTRRLRASIGGESGLTPLPPHAPGSMVAFSVAFQAPRRLIDSRSSLYTSQALITTLAKDLGLKTDSEKAVRSSELQLHAHLGQLHEQTLEELKRQVHRLRKQYDELRAGNKSLTVKVQAVQGDLSALDRLSGLLTVDDAMKSKSRTDAAETKITACEVRIEELESARAVYSHMCERLSTELLQDHTQTTSMHSVLSDLLAQVDDAVTGTHAANTQRARTEAKLAKLKLVLEAGRLDRARRMKALEASGNVQDMIIRTVKEREEARRNIHSLPLGDLDEDSEERLKLLFLVRKAYAKMLLKKVQEDQRRCDSLESAFQTIRQATGLTDVSDIVKKFLSRQSTFDGLQRQTSKTRDRIDSLKAEKARLSQLLSDLSLSRGPSNQHRDTYIKMEEYERRLRAADEAYNKAREDVVRTSVAMEDCRTCLTKLLAKFPKDEEDEYGDDDGPIALASKEYVLPSSAKQSQVSFGGATAQQTPGGSRASLQSAGAFDPQVIQKSLEEMFVELDRKVSFMMEYLKAVIEKEGQPPHALFELGTVMPLSRHASEAHTLGKSASTSGHASQKLIKSMMASTQAPSGENLRVPARTTTPTRPSGRPGASLASSSVAETGSVEDEEELEDDTADAVMSAINLHPSERVMDRGGVKRLANMYKQQHEGNTGTPPLSKPPQPR